MSAGLAPAGIAASFAARARHEHADAPHAVALLRARHKRPRRRASERGYEFAPSHSITSSASARTKGGILAFAALRLTTSSNLVA
jgi:hypothetical protein